MNVWFAKIAARVSQWTGSSWAFILALLVIVVWGASGPLFGFSNTWQLVINTRTTIVTFLMVFLIQNTQNRETRALQLKLDELLRAQAGAREWTFVNLEDKSEQELEQAKSELLQECNICANPEEHQHHGEPEWLQHHSED